MTKIALPPHPTSGLRVTRSFRNARITDGASAAALANMLNGLGRRQKFLFSYALRLDNGNGGYYGDFGWTRCYTSPNCGGVRARVCLAPGGSTTNSNYYFTVNAYANPVRYAPSTNSGVFFGIPYLSEMMVDDVELVTAASTPITGAQEFNLKLTSSQYANVTAFTVYEVPKASLDTSSDLCVDPGQFGYGSPIHDAQLDDLWDSAWTLHGHGAHHVYYSFVPANIASVPINHGNTYSNVVDGSTTAWSVNDLGYWYRPTYHGRLSSNNVPVVYWAYMKVTVGGTGSCRFEDDDGTLATITGVTSTSYAYYTTTGNLNASKGRRLCVIKGHNSVGGASTTQILAAGFYEKR